MTDQIRVSCAAGEGGWACDVRVGPDGRDSRHLVTVTPGELAHFAPGAAEPTTLVERSFEFLLEREAKESIMARFSLSTIEHYFPEYTRVIAGRFG